MREKNRTLLGILVLGLLLCGIGGGVMFREFSSLDYGGEYVFRTETPETSVTNLSLEGYDGPIRIICDWPPALKEITVDETMEEGLLRIETAYDPEGVTPRFSVCPAEDEPEEKPVRSGVLELRYVRRRSSLAVLLRLKKQFLNDLKADIVRDYRYEDVFGLSVTAAPETAARLRLIL